MISTKFKYFFDGFGQYVVFTTKKQCKEYLKANPNINRIKDLKEIGIEEWNKISEHPRDKVFEIIDNEAIPMEIKTIDTIDEVPKESEIHPTPLPYEKENCPNCADQASIAAPGQTTLCRTHDDERHYSEMRKFFDEQINDFHMTSFLPFCSRCGKDAPDYVIIMHDSKMNPLIFAACADCRNELTLKQNAARAAQERIGA